VGLDPSTAVAPHLSELASIALTFPETAFNVGSLFNLDVMHSLSLYLFVHLFSEAVELGYPGVGELQDAEPDNWLLCGKASGTRSVPIDDASKCV
jgi:hypothetical protein